MKTYLDCMPCFMSQALRACRLATDDDVKIKKVIDKTAQLIQEIPMHYTPPQIGAYVYSYISEITGNSDPFLEVKRKNIDKAFELYDYFEKKMSSEADPLKAAVMLSISGNVIDMGVRGIINIEEEAAGILDKFKDIPDLGYLRGKLDRSKTVLFLGDNSGEAVFDLFLLKQLENKKVYYAVREIPVINDITRKEAELIGIDRYAEVISSGVKAPGTVLDRVSGDFLEIFSRADVIISKGQGNYEALSEVERDIFFLLIAKCPVIARNIGTDVGTPLLLYKKQVNNPDTVIN